MRVVHVTTVPTSLIFIAGQIDWMRERGVDVHVISSPGAELDAFGAAHSVPVYGVEMPRAITPLEDLKAVRALARVIRGIRPDIVHAHTPKGGLLGMMAATAACVPYKIYHMRGLLTLTAKGARRRLLAAAESTSTELADLVICQSHSLRAEALKQGLVTTERSTVLVQGSNGVNTQRFAPNANLGQMARSELGIPQDARVVGFVGRLVGDKGVRELATAWREIGEDPRNHLLIVGDYEPRDPVPESTREFLSHAPNVHIVGWQTDTPRFYAAMDLLVLPTYREGFPNVPLEAAAMGLPVVATEVVGCVDAVADGVTGTLVPARNVPRLREAIERYLESPELAQRHGESGRMRMVTEFDPEVIYEALYHVYCHASGH